MTSMDRITEETNESLVQRKLSSQKWPSLSVGLFKGNFILIFSLTCFAGTIAQDAFQMKFAYNPTKNVNPGTPVNLTCSFKLQEKDFRQIVISKKSDEIYSKNTTQESFKGLEHHGISLSTDPTVDSAFWMTANPSFCSDSSLKREYTCWVQNSGRDFTQEEVEVSYQGPVLEVIVDGEQIQNVSSTYSVSLRPDQIEKDIEIKIVAKNLLSAPSDLKLSIGEVTLPSMVTPKDDVKLCIYERELIATYKFPESGKYEFKYSGPPHDATIKVTVKDVPTTTTKATTTTTTGKTTPPEAPQMKTAASIPPVVVSSPTPTTDDGGKGGILGKILLSVGVIGGAGGGAGAGWYWWSRKQKEKKLEDEQNKQNAEEKPLDPLANEKMRTGDSV